MCRIRKLVKTLPETGLIPSGKVLVANYQLTFANLAINCQLSIDLNQQHFYENRTR